MKTAKCPILFLLVTFTISLLFVTGCEKANPDKLTADRDAAETTAGAIGLNTGGALDQISDLCDFLVPDLTQALDKHFPKTYFILNKAYNVGTGTWTIHIERERGIAGDTPYAYINRDYTLQFLNAGGFPQQLYVTGIDTARTVHFNVTQGSGTHRTRRISQQLDSLYAAWTITEAHLPIVTINGVYARAAVDTISGWDKLRTSNHKLQLTFSDITAPRGGQPAYPYFYQAVSGNIYGTFDADITFLSGSAYSEANVHRAINITLGEGKGIIETGISTFKAGLASGELVN